MTNRRGPGEGTIRERRPDLFEGRIRAQGEQRSVYGKTRAEVRAKMRDLARHAELGLSLAGGRQTTADYLERWLDGVARHRVRATTFQRYAQLLRTHAVPTIGSVPVAKVTGQHLSSLYSSRLDAGQSARSVLHLHNVLHSAFRQAVRWDLITRNPADLVSPPRPARHEITTLTPAQVRTMLEVAEEDPLEALYVLAVTTGMRQGELLGLTWSAVDVADARLEVRASLVHRRAAEWSLEDPKSQKSRRRVRLSAAAVTALRAHRIRQAQARLLVGSDWQDHDLVFTDAWGGPLDGSHVTGRDFRQLLARAGLPRVRFHDLRHTAATLLLASGTHPKMVQELLGHSTIALTLDVYSHVTPSMHDEAANTMDRILAR